MKKIIIVLVAAIALVACGGGTSGSSSMKTEADSLSYAFGVDVGHALKNLDSTTMAGINIDKVIGAIRDVWKDKAKMTAEESYEFRREFFMVRIPAKAKVASEEYLANIEKNTPNIQKSESGLLYEILEPGDETRPMNDRDTVMVVYEGKLKDGRVFDSSRERNDTARLTLNRVIKGWSEGMKYVGRGGKVRLYIPAELGYGPNGMGQAIGPNEALVFDVDLVDVLPYNAPQE